MNNRAVSSGDHSFDAGVDGKHVYCFSNEAWAAGTKEVSFNVHGIVYVPESEAVSDPLEHEGMWGFSLGCVDGVGLGWGRVPGGWTCILWGGMRIGVYGSAVKGGSEGILFMDVYGLNGRADES